MPLTGNQQEQPERTVEQELQELGARREAYKGKPHLDLMAHLQEQVDEAYEQMVGNLSNDPMVCMRLQLRWQQREVMLRAAQIFCESAEQQYQQIVEQMSEELTNR